MGIEEILINTCQFNTNEVGSGATWLKCDKSAIFFFTKTKTKFVKPATAENKKYLTYDAWTHYGGEQVVELLRLASDLQLVPLQSVHAFASISCTINNHASRVFDHRTVELAPLVLSAPDKVGLAGANDVVGQTPRLLSIFNIFTREDADIQLVLPPVAL